MTEALKNTISDIYHNILAYLSGITMMDVLDVLLVTAVVYFAIQLLRKSNAFNVLKGLLLLLVLLWVSEIFQLHVLSFLIDSTLKVAVLAFIIIFQPELRRMLGQVTHLAGMISRPDVPDMESEISQTVEACRSMSRDRQGALIAFQRQVELTDIAKTGTLLNASITNALLKNIFYPKAPLHDGAVIVQNGRITGAGCMLPLTSSSKLSRELGMRHRAGVGMSENSDAIVVIVSEETGSISVATNGMLKRHLSPETLEKLLRLELMPDKEAETARGVAGWMQRVRKKGEQNDLDKKA